MHSDREKERLTLPKEQSSEAPYEAMEDDKGPIVTMTPDSLSQDEAPVARDAPPAESSDDAVRWQANEFIHRHKSPMWFILFFLITAVLTAGAFIVKEYTFGILVPVMAAALFVYTRRPPRLISYTLTAKGLFVNDHLYSFAEFKGFGVIHDDGEFSIMLIPTKRFMPGVMVYFPEEAGEQIVDMLGARLPMRKLRLDIIDRIIRQLRI